MRACGGTLFFCALRDEFSENLRFRNKLKKGLISCACCDIL
nr:MAG TPA: hypothetical protein [Caudoviricetes sp.]